MEQKQKTYKVFDASDLQMDEGSREIICTINTDTVDRDNEVVLPRGLMRANYQGNPVVMLNHDYQKLPVGVCLWIKPSADGKALVAKWKCTDKTQDGRDAWALMSDDPPVIRSFSVGFIPDQQSPPTPEELDINPAWADARNVIRSWELLEFSLCGIPANPQALMLAHSKGVSAKTCNFLCPDWNKANDNHWEFEKPIPAPKHSRSWTAIEAELRMGLRH